MSVHIHIASAHHATYADKICDMIEIAAHKRGTGIAKRDPEYVKKKIRNGNSVIAIDDDDGTLVGFCYIEIWENKKYVANSGLIVNPDYRGQGIAKKIKAKAFELSRKKYPGSKLFGITTSLPVMKINSDLGYKPVTFSELTQDDTFWSGCQSCPNYDILTRNEHKNCLCTGMMFDPEKPNITPKKEREKNIAKYYRWVKLKTAKFLDFLNPINLFL
jgi:GNAT superfamily N-acetyltransferase